MTAVGCNREHEIVRAAVPRCSDPLTDDLREHVETCPHCCEVMTIVSVLRDERDAALRDLRVPAAGQVWWRSAIRAHAEATEAARRPMLWLQGIAGACAVGICAALVTLIWPSAYDAAAAVVALPAEFAPDMTPLVKALRTALPFALGVLACLVVTPLVIYLALSDD